MKLHVRHVFPCSPAEFWRIFWDERYDRMLDDAAGLRREVLEEWMEEGQRCWRVRFRPEGEKAGMAARLLGPGLLEYEQEGRWDEAAGVVHWRVLPQSSSLAGKVDAAGVLAVRPVDGGCERTVSGDVVVKIPLLGSTIESQVRSSVVESYERAAEVTGQWLDRGGPPPEFA